VSTKLSILGPTLRRSRQRSGTQDHAPEVAYIFPELGQGVPEVGMNQTDVLAKPSMDREEERVADHVCEWPRLGRPSVDTIALAVTVG